MKQNKKLGFIASLLVVLSACNAFVAKETIFGSGVESVFTYAGANRDLKTEVIGNPFSVSKAVTEKAVTDAMQGSDFGINAHFTTQPSSSALDFWRVVVLFNPPKNLPEWEVCGNRGGLTSGAGGDDLQVLMVFCSGDFAESWVNSSAAAFTTPNDPRFANLIGNTAFMLLPSRGQNSDFF